MSTLAVCTWGTAAAGPCRTIDGKSQTSSCNARKVQGLIPVVGAFPRKQDVEVKNLRWDDGRKPSRTDNKVQKWRAQSSANNEMQTKVKAISVSESQFESEVINSPVPVLVDFWATWCGPCRLMGLALDWAAQEYEGKLKCVKIESDKNQALVDKYKVYGLPTLILFMNGEPMPNSHREGALKKEKLQKYIEENLPAVASSS